ncbi:MAG TPA: C40 family peptidase, partial [Pseudonocardia sp.]|nr:C40 family peptidase [Pseudonocardia sp.]
MATARVAGCGGPGRSEAAVAAALSGALAVAVLWGVQPAGLVVPDSPDPLPALGPSALTGQVAPEAFLPGTPGVPAVPGLGALLAAQAPPAPDASAPVQFTTAAPDERVRIAIEFALAQLGVPYLWGGDGPAEGGFDCSGLTTAAYAAAGITLPRTAQTQFGAGPHVPNDADLMPGDLVFYGTPDRVHHVGLYLGEGRMVNAPRRGKPVQVASVRYPGDDYLGATRPAAVPGSLRPGTLAQVASPSALVPAPATPPPAE